MLLKERQCSIHGMKICEYFNFFMKKNGNSLNVFQNLNMWVDFPTEIFGTRWLERLQEANRIS